MFEKAKFVTTYLSWQVVGKLGVVTHYLSLWACPLSEMWVSYGHCLHWKHSAEFVLIRNNDDAGVDEERMWPLVSPHTDLHWGVFSASVKVTRWIKVVFFLLSKCCENSPFAQWDRLKDVKCSYLILPSQSAKSLITGIAFNQWGTDCTVRARNPNPVLLKAVMNAHFFFFIYITFSLLIKRHHVQNEKTFRFRI